MKTSNIAKNRSDRIWLSADDCQVADLQAGRFSTQAVCPVTQV